jgi:CRP-like cAMP-binding protein
MGLLLQLPRSASVVVTRAASLRKVTIDNFAHVIAEHPTETRELLQQLAGRLHEADRRLVL